MLKKLKRKRKWRNIFSNSRLYTAWGETLLKPRKLSHGQPDINYQHFSFLDGRTKPSTTQERIIHAVLCHEQAHSERQIKIGLYCWVVKYKWSKSFRLNEEKIAHKAEFKMLMKYQFKIKPDVYAQEMSGKAYGNMISYEDALYWIQLVISGEDET